MTRKRVFSKNAFVIHLFRTPTVRTFVHCLAFETTPAPPENAMHHIENFPPETLCAGLEMRV